MKIFGKNATLKTDVRENCLHQLQVGDLLILVLSWEISEFEIEGLNLGEGHLISFRIIEEGKEFNLFQHEGVFYSEEDSLPIRRKEESLSQGDGLSGPRWYKCDREWPVRESRGFDFVTQFYFGETVAYLFKDESEGSKVYAIFKDQITRQDAEEHYKLEAEQGGAGQRR